jgi:NAD(P)-dependent dehydrogenase (short-subunit alcohol dehydrogenase family)
MNTTRGSGGRLEGMVAIVTGAGSSSPGIGNGRATAILCAREGARVALVDNHLERAQETLDLIATEREGSADDIAIPIEADVTSNDDCRRVVEATVGRFGRLDILDNNVGIGMGRASVVDITEEGWDRVMEVNVKSMMLMSKHAVPAMKASGGGSIVNISSLSALRPRGLTTYTTSKGAVIALTKAMAVDHAPDNIRVNCIAPGPVYTPMVARGMTPELRAVRAKAAPLAFEGSAWDIAWAAVFLASPEARWITGIVLPVDGGLSLVAPER